MRNNTSTNCNTLSIVSQGLFSSSTSLDSESESTTGGGWGSFLQLSFNYDIPTSIFACVPRWLLTKCCLCLGGCFETLLDLSDSAALLTGALLSGVSRWTNIEFLQ